MIRKPLFAATIMLGCLLFGSACNRNPSADLAPVDLKSFDIVSLDAHAEQVEKTLTTLPGVTAVTVNPKSSLAVVVFQTDAQNQESILAALENQNLTASVHKFPERKGGGKCPIPHQLFDPSSWF